MEIKPRIFISCGQYTQEERTLGKAICDLVRELCPSFEPYFAEDQSSVEGLSNNILSALLQCAGLICVMHRRGEITLPDGKTVTRGSVWIEQEIAIAAAMNFWSGRSVRILFYQEEGVSLEGIRKLLVLNPRVEFKDAVEVLNDLRTVLPTVKFTPHSAYDLEVDVSQRERYKGQGGREYTLFIVVRNTGQLKVDAFELRVWFPRSFLNSLSTLVYESAVSSTPTHFCLAYPSRGVQPSGLYPGDGLDMPIRIDYFVDHALFDSGEFEKAEIKYELFSGSMLPKRETLPLATLPRPRYQNF